MNGGDLILILKKNKLLQKKKKKKKPFPWNLPLATSAHVQLATQRPLAISHVTAGVHCPLFI
jgi:hypothetical protein